MAAQKHLSAILCAVVIGIIALLTNRTIAATNNANSLANEVAPQIHLRARFIEIERPENPLGFDWYLGHFLNGTVVADRASLPDASSTNPATNVNFSSVTNQQLTGVLTDPNFRVVLHALAQRRGCEIIAEPECVITSGRHAQLRATDIREIMTEYHLRQAQSNPMDPMVVPLAGTKNKELGPMVDVVPSILSNSYTIHLEVIASNREYLENENSTNAEPVFRLLQSGKASANLWDRQTLVLGNLKMVSVKTNNQTLNESKVVSNEEKEKGTGNKELFIFITATIVDSVGNRVYSDDNLPFNPLTIPPQPNLPSSSR